MTTTPPEAPSGPPPQDPTGDSGPRVTRDEVRDLGRLRRSPHRPQGRRRRRRTRPAPRHRPARPAGRVRRAGLLRRRRPDPVRRLLAAGARGRRRPGGVQPRRAHPLGRADRRRRARRAGAGRRLLGMGRLLVPLAGGDRRADRPVAADPQQPACQAGRPPPPAPSTPRRTRRPTHRAAGAPDAAGPVRRAPGAGVLPAAAAAVHPAGRRTASARTRASADRSSSGSRSR